MSARIRIELCDERGNRASVEMVGHENQHVTGFSNEAEKMALKLLNEVKASAVKPEEKKP